MMVKEHNHAKLRWRCHRGMLELDLILLPFFDHHFDQLTSAQKQVFERLLQCEDPQLLAWFMGYEQSTDRELATLVELITTAHHT